MANPPVQTPDPNQLSFREALLIVLSICALLIIFVFLRFACNIAIDLFILCNLDSVRVTMSQWKDFFCPCFKRRMVNPLFEMPREGLTNGTEHPLHIDSLLSGLSGLTPVDRQRVLEFMMPFKIVSDEDLRQWKDRLVETASIQSGDRSLDSNSVSINSKHAIVCSICIQDLEFGDEAIITMPCKHYFHRICIMEWVNGNHTECPYCRAAMFTRADVDNALSEFHAVELEDSVP